MSVYELSVFGRPLYVNQITTIYFPIFNKESDFVQNSTAMAYELQILYQNVKKQEYSLKH